jgi:hypothetical protein
VSLLQAVSLTQKIDKCIVNNDDFVTLRRKPRISGNKAHHRDSHSFKQWSALCATFDENDEI